MQHLRTVNSQNQYSPHRSRIPLLLLRKEMYWGGGSRLILHLPWGRVSPSPASFGDDPNRYGSCYLPTLRSLSIHPFTSLTPTTAPSPPPAPRRGCAEDGGRRSGTGAWRKGRNVKRWRGRGGFGGSFCEVAAAGGIRGWYDYVRSSVSGSVAPHDYRRLTLSANER